MEVYDSNDTNFLAKKDDFVEAIINGNVIISEESWHNFIPIFATIKNILVTND